MPEDRVVADSNRRMLSTTVVDGCIASSGSPIADSKAVNPAAQATTTTGSDSSGPEAGSDSAITRS